jgi:HlyD family secretion protein
MTNRTWMFLATAGLAGTLGYRALTGAPVAAATAPAPAAPGLIAPGRVEPHRAAIALMFDQPGRIREVLVEEGAHVVAGQVVARQDDRGARARVGAATAAVAIAQAQLDQLRRGARPDERAAARAEAEAAHAAAVESAAARVRADHLTAVAALAAADADRERARAEVDAAHADAADARARLVTRGARVEELRAAAARLDLAQAELVAAQVALDQTELRAPSEGVVLRRLAEPGAMVSPTIPTPVIELADRRALELRVEIDEADVGRVALGQRGAARALAWSDRAFPGRITRITAAVGRRVTEVDDPRARVDTRVLEVVFTLDDAGPAQALPLGLRMDVALDAGAIGAPSATTALQ